MKTDRYSFLSAMLMLSIVISVSILKQYWLLPIFGAIACYTYYKRLQLIPKEERTKAVLPTIIGIVLILALAVYYRFAV